MRLITLYLTMPIGFYLFGLPGGIFGMVLAYFTTIPMIVKHAVRHDIFDLRKELLVLPAVPAGLIAGTFVNYVIELVRPHI